MRHFMALIIRKDRLAFYFMNKRIKCTVLDQMMPLITHLGSVTVAMMISIMMIILDWLKIVEGGIFVGISVVVSQTLIHAIKLVVNRPRPTITLEDVNDFNSVLEYYSFPSGHTAAAFSIAVAIALLNPITIVSILLLVLACLVGISRMYIGVHYPTDVMIGAILSTVVVLMLQPYISAFYDLL